MQASYGEPAQINRDYVRLLMVMRRFIKEEFNQAIRISEEGAAARMLEYGEKSRNRVLREMAAELKGFVQPEPAQPTPPQARYRGVAMAKETGATDEAAKETAVVRIYRGRPLKA